MPVEKDYGFTWQASSAPSSAKKGGAVNNGRAKNTPGGRTHQVASSSNVASQAVEPTAAKFHPVPSQISPLKRKRSLKRRSTFGPRGYQEQVFGEDNIPGLKTKEGSVIAQTAFVQVPLSSHAPPRKRLRSASPEVPYLPDMEVSSSVAPEHAEADAGAGENDFESERLQTRSPSPSRVVNPYVVPNPRPTPVKRPRGHPRKVAPQRAMTPLTQAAKRPRGRSRKVFPVPVTPQKRGPERPRKSLPAPVAGSANKRGPGRPRKSLPAPAAESAGKRGPGRPRKSLPNLTIPADAVASTSAAAAISAGEPLVRYCTGFYCDKHTKLPPRSLYPYKWCEHCRKSSREYQRERKQQQRERGKTTALGMAGTTATTSPMTRGRIATTTAAAAGSEVLEPPKRTPTAFKTYRTPARSSRKRKTPASGRDLSTSPPPADLEPGEQLEQSHEDRPGATGADEPEQDGAEPLDDVVMPVAETLNEVVEPATPLVDKPQNAGNEARTPAASSPNTSLAKAGTTGWWLDLVNLTWRRTSTSSSAPPVSSTSSSRKALPTTQFRKFASLDDLCLELASAYRTTRARIVSQSGLLRFADVGAEAEDRRLRFNGAWMMSYDSDKALDEDYLRSLLEEVVLGSNVDSIFETETDDPIYLKKGGLHIVVISCKCAVDGHQTVAAVEAHTCGGYMAVSAEKMDAPKNSLEVFVEVVH